MADSLDKMCEDMDICEHELTESEDHLPCYFTRYSVTDDFNTITKIKRYIKLARAECNKKCSVMFSVTEHDEYFKLWLDIARASPNTFTVWESGSRHGPYKCWAIMARYKALPVSKKGK